ncbi:NADH dehydrogenase, alpha subcomplex, subunit 2 [Fistulina hepatica ATCC 64428]|uniref:NADH dehydrogenase, alpha subcomplex, subunit 2 n=1 Tax=Fistulina hepatica ATCC 64428 TaxID=1128425 RepID=A0A0D7AMZ0_9AGAR|nr:NADH dehydrogenase, alpha subcomplex, subunit 2 [Fistulina hepatica ATCC 64428]
MSLARSFSPALRELRFLFSQTGPASAGTRDFVLSKYLVIKQHNPDLPVLIREAHGTPARVFARFERGVEKHVELENLSASDVESKVASLIQQS